MIIAKMCINDSDKEAKFRLLERKLLVLFFEIIPLSPVGESKACEQELIHMEAPANKE